jgi:hypothetical protein
MGKLNRTNVFISLSETPSTPLDEAEWRVFEA